MIEFKPDIIIEGFKWSDDSCFNEDRPVWTWHTDDHLDWSEGVEAIGHEMVGISISFGQSKDGMWAVRLSLDESEEYRKSIGLTEIKAKTRAIALAKAIRTVWPC